MFSAGFARIDITPPFGTPFSGYYRVRLMNGILDPLQLNALAVSDGESTSIIIACDILGIRRQVAEKIRRRIEAKTGVPADHIIVCALHQHTSFVLLEAPGRHYVDDPIYMETLFRKFEDVACMAVDDLGEATMETAAEETAEQISFVRRYRMKDGSVETNPGRCHPEMVAFASEPDNTVRLVRFRRPNAKDIALVNFSTHPDVIGGNKTSADWPGFVRRFVERDRENVCCLVVNGAQGDVNHIDYFRAEQWTDRYEYSGFMGRTIADTVDRLWDCTVPHADTRLFAEIRLVQTRTNTEGEEQYEECKKFMDSLEPNTLGYQPHITEIAYAHRIVRLREETIYRTVPVTVLGIGDVAFVGFGGEPFTVYGTKAREAAPDKFVIAVCCANGYEGYLPSAAAFAEGGYESSGSLFTPEIEERCTSVAAELLAKF